MTTKAEARKTLQRMLANLRADMRDVEKFAADNRLEFSFLGMKYFLKDPNGSNRWAKKGIFVSESEWQASGWGCDSTPSYDRYSEWEEKNFPYDEDAVDEDEEDPVELEEDEE